MILIHQSRNWPLGVRLTQALRLNTLSTLSFYIIAIVMPSVGTIHLFHEGKFRYMSRGAKPAPSKEAD